MMMQIRPLQYCLREKSRLTARLTRCLVRCLPVFLILIGQIAVRAQTPKPILVSTPTSTRAIVLDAVQFTPEPFLSTSPAAIYPGDKRTRIMLFAMNLSLQSGEAYSSVTAQAQDASQNLYDLQVEYVGKIPGMEWVSQITLRLADMGDVGDLLIKVSYHGLSSNRVRVAIGHIGGGLNDDADSTPTPVPPYTITGRVMEGAAGLEGVNVTLTGAENATTITGPGGGYSFTVGTPGNYSLRAARQFYAFNPADLVLNNLTSNRSTGFSASRITFAVGGRVFDDHGNAMNNVAVALRTGNSEQAKSTGSDGAFLFTGVPAGFGYSVKPSDTSLFAFTSQDTGELTANLSLTCSGTLRNYTIRGTIDDPWLHAVSGVQVTLSGAANLSAVTDINGGYVFAGLPAGRSYELGVSRIDYLFDPPVRGYELLRDENADFTATRQYRLNGRVVDANGRGLMGVKVNLSGAETSSVRTPSDGSYSFTVTTPGDYLLTPAQQYYQFVPASKSLPNLADHQTVNFTGAVAITGPISVLEFDGTPRMVDYGVYWPQNTNVGQFFWEFWAMPGENTFARYMLTDGYGGAHTLLFGFNYNNEVNGHYSLMGNIWTDSGVFYFNSDEGPSPGEWGHYAVGWDGQSIITYYNGVPVGKQHFTGPRISTGLYNGSTLLMIGGSDHQNFIGRIAQVRGFEENNPRAWSPESAFAPETIFSVDGQLLSYYLHPAQAVADLSYGYNGVQHPGYPRSFSGSYFNGCNPCNPPQSVIDPTAPDFANPTNPGSLTTLFDPPPATPDGAVVFDSFSRNNSTYALGGAGGLGVTETGSAGVRSWQTNAGAGQLKPFGILNGRAVLLADAMAIAWISTGAADGNLGVQVKRSRGNFGSGSNTGLSFRVVDKDNFFFAYTSDDPAGSSNPKTLSIGYYQSGVRKVIDDSITIPSVDWLTLTAVTTQSGSINIYADDALIYSTSSSINANGTSAGLYNNSGGLSLTNRWDDFAVFSVPELRSTRRVH